jgi:hypothetical protein
MWNDGLDFRVAVPAAANVWIWHEKLFASNSGWILFSQVPGASPSSPSPIDGLVYLEGGTPQLAAVRDGKLSLRDLPAGAQWNEVTTPVPLNAIAPVLVDDGNGRLITSAAAGMIGISGTKLYRVFTNGTCTPLLATYDFDSKIQPAAVLLGVSLAVLAVTVSSDTPLNPPTLVAKLGAATPVIEVLEDHVKVLGPLDVELHGGALHFLAAVTGAGENYLTTWAPFAANPRRFKIQVPSNVGQIGGGPLLLDHDVLVPGAHADVFVATFDLSLRFSANALIEPGIVLPLTAPTLSQNDVVAMVAGVLEFHTVMSAGTTLGNEVFYPIDAPFSGSATGPLLAYRASSPLGGTGTPPDTLDLDGNDHDAVQNTFLFVENDLHEIVILTTGSPWSVIVTPANLVVAGASPYAEPLETGGRTAPFMQLIPATTGNWDAAILDRVKLVFPGATPEEQSAKAFATSGIHPTLVVMGEEFSVLPANPTSFIADGAVGEWSRRLGDASSNPELSWEYWNGTGWWKLNLKVDETSHLKSSGAVRFLVPDDIAPTDWSGRTNYWIRARLIGGEYGTGAVTITTTQNGTTSTQIITRDTGGAPSVLSLHISYRLCKGTLPKLVLTRDSGSFRDQSDANRTRGAIVEAFVSLAIAIGRLSSPVAAPVPAAGRMIFIGLTASPSGTPVNVLLLVEKEHIEHEQFAPLKTDALIANRFEPIVADDATRAVGESGLLKMTFAREPTLRELFGIDNLAWLRLTPRGSGPVSQWQPSIRGAYLNAVWASAQETLTRELVGSSEGAPNLTLFLARPPLLEGTLELRVKEPLGEEERQHLREGDENRLRSDVVGLPGDWVLWDEVTDPLDEPATARVYALDESNGEIRFGDGQHGRIPPIGRDSIVAFRYRRTEAIPANDIPARAPLDLVSPIPTVEAVFAADPSAGGAPPETDERVLRFGTSRLRHRNRAVTAQDFEDLALESSPDIEQARCFVRPGSVRLVVVLRGDQPVPSAAQVRELRRHLLASAPASLSAAGALRITGPRILRLRVVLQLLVASLDDAGGVAHDIEEKLRARFDEWPLGASPVESDIALTVIDTRHLESLGNVEFLEISPDGKESPWTGAVARDQLVMLDKDAVRLEFKTVEVLA